MPESGTYGSVRGVPGNRHPYRDRQQRELHFCVEALAPECLNHWLRVCLMTGDHELLIGSNLLWVHGSSQTVSVQSSRLDGAFRIRGR